MFASKTAAWGEIRDRHISPSRAPVEHVQMEELLMAARQTQAGTSLGSVGGKEQVQHDGPLEVVDGK